MAAPAATTATPPFASRQRGGEGLFALKSLASARPARPGQQRSLREPKPVLSAGNSKILAGGATVSPGEFNASPSRPTVSTHQRRPSQYQPQEFNKLKLAWNRRAINDWNLVPVTRLVLTELTHLQHWERGCAFPSQETIAFRLGIGVRTVGRALKQAEERGWLKRRRHGLKKPNTYEMTEDPSLVAAINQRNELRRLADPDPTRL